MPETHNLSVVDGESPRYPYIVLTQGVGAGQVATRVCAETVWKFWVCAAPMSFYTNTDSLRWGPQRRMVQTMEEMSEYVGLECVGALGGHSGTMRAFARDLFR